jgi:hypothetical protein
MKITHRPMHGVSIILALAVLLVVMSVLSACVQPYPAESKTMGTQPICLFFCLVTQTTIEDNRADTFTPTVGTSTTGGSRSRSTNVTDSPNSALY